ncbi:hypothetical protein [Polyangium sorediatum]|uniref:Uncharacterized protein n=1 Tax=Polyangium sorediatum TaxID=889274 RepID=A0ABT6NQP1_9BACT|nr:hypothetical protein [Polyangium sorediatum]MDI1430603.1 hypothetical protein [Polyangium sorediatum]
MVTKVISPFFAVEPGGSGKPSSRGDQSPPSRVERSDRGEREEGEMGFVLESGDAAEPLPCRLVLGFREALSAAEDPAVAMPARLVIVEPDGRTDDWLARWSEDDEQVRRTVTICRTHDATKVTAVVTLASYGRGTATSLAVESVTLPQRRRIVRSGVHPKSFLDAVLSRVRQGQGSAGAASFEPTDPSPSA